MTRPLALVVLALTVAGAAAAQTDLAALGVDALERRVAAAPADVPARRALADRLTAEGQPTEAIPHLQRLAEADPADVAVRQQLARHLVWAGRAAEAVPVLEEVVALDPGADAARLQIAEIVTWNGGADRAVAVLAPLAEREPDDAAVQRAYAFALLAAGRPGVRAQLSRALALLPDDPDLLVESGALERWQGDWSLGRDRLRRARRLPLRPEQRARVRDLLEGLSRQMAPRLTTSAERVEDSNGVVRVETPARLDVALTSRWALGLELSGDQIGSTAPSAPSVGAARAVPSVAFSPRRGTRIEVAAGAELVDGARAVAIARALAEQTWSGARFALARLSATTVSATDATGALDGGIRRTHLAAEGYAEPAETLALSGTLGAFLYSDDNRRVQAAASARWLPVRLGRRAEDPPVVALGPSAGALYEDSQTVYPASAPYYTPDRLTTLSLGLAARLSPLAGLTVEGSGGLAYQTGPGEDAASAELGAAVGFEHDRHTVRFEARRSGSAVYAADVVRLTYQIRAW